MSARTAWTPRPFIRASIWLHAVAGVALVAWPAQWAAALAVLLANHAAIAALSLSPHSQWVGPTLCRLPREHAQQGLVSLTFDDGPDPTTTAGVLDALDAAGAKASFFCVGAQAAAHPALVAEIARRGHAVENHTWSHPYGFALLGPRAMAWEMQRTQALLRRQTGRRPRWVRAPAGLRSPLLEPALARTGLSHVSWTRRGYDTACRDPARVLRRLTRGLAGGDILLLHDSARGIAPGGGPMVLAVLPALLDAISAAGLRAVPLPPPPPAYARPAAQAVAAGPGTRASAANASR